MQIELPTLIERVGSETSLMEIDNIIDLKVLLMGAGKTGKTTLFHM